MPKRNFKSNAKNRNNTPNTPQMKKFLEKITKKRKPNKKKKKRSSSPTDSPTDNDYKNETEELQQKKPSNSKPLSNTKIIWRISIIIAIIGGLCMLQWNAELYNASGIVRDEKDSTSFYDILEISTSATQQEIKKSYRTLSYKYHPDRNPNCGKRCEDITAKLNNAHEILSNKEKREVYDNTQGSISSIFSNSIELTFDNFDDYVSQSRGLFIIQVYSELHAECVKFSPIWEEAIERFEGYVQFGRVHATKQISVMKYLGTAVRDFPTVLSYVNSRYYRTYPALHFPQELFDLIHEDYPTNHLWIATESNIDTIHKKWLQSSLPMIAVISKKIMPSILVSWMGRQYEGLIQFAHFYPKPLSSKSRKRSKISTGRVRFISQALTEVFDIPTIKTLPKLLTILPQSNAQLIEEKIDKTSFLKFIHKYVQKLVPKLNAWTFSTVCTNHDIYCIVYLLGCSDVKQKNSLQKYLRLSSRVMNKFNEELAEYYLPKWIQFAYADVRLSPELMLLCYQRNDTQLIVTSEAATLVTVAWVEDGEKYMKIDDFDAESLFTFVKDILEHESVSPALDAPRIIPPVLPRKTFVDDFFEYLENIDWRDKDFQLNLIIICGMIGSVVLFKAVGLKNTVLALFALSICGGILPYIFGGGGESEGGRSKRRRRK